MLPEECGKRKWEASFALVQSILTSWVKRNQQYVILYINAIQFLMRTIRRMNVKRKVIYFCSREQCWLFLLFVKATQTKWGVELETTDKYALPFPIKDPVARHEIQSCWYSHYLKLETDCLLILFKETNLPVSSLSAGR